MFNNDKDKSPETLFLLDEENNKKEIKQMKSKSENNKKLLEEIEKLKKENNDLKEQNIIKEKEIL